MTSFPTFVEEENDLISLEEYLTDNIHASFMLKIKNDVLEKIAILKGDLVIVERKTQVSPGEIALGLANGHHSFFYVEKVEGKTTLRSFETDSSPEGSVQIIGVIKGVIRKY